MKIRYEEFGGTSTDEVSAFVVDGLDEKEYNGVVECAASNSEAALNALGRLCDVLAGKGLVDAMDIMYIVRGYNEDAELVGDEP